MLSERFGADDRARLTPVDVVYFGVGFLILAFMAKPIYTVLNSNASELSAGAAYLYQMIFPAMIITLHTVVYLTGASGGGK